MLMSYRLQTDTVFMNTDLLLVVLLLMLVQVVEALNANPYPSKSALMEFDTVCC